MAAVWFDELVILDARQQKLNQLAATALLDTQLNLPVLDPALSLEQILD